MELIYIEYEPQTCKNFFNNRRIYLVSSRSFHPNRVAHIHSKKIFNYVILKSSICNTRMIDCPLKKELDNV